MKISIGAELIDGPFGGGNIFIINLVKALKEKGYEVVNNLKDNDIDIIFLVNPLLGSTISTFDNIDIDYYLTFKNKSAITIQRINECDERKNTNYVNKKIISSNKNIDFTVFVSEWLRDLYINEGINTKDITVVKGGPKSTIFNSFDKEKWNKTEKLKIVTHHWSDNWMKGFDVYSKLDLLTTGKRWKDKIEFTYIGNIPKELEFKNTKTIKPLRDEQLAKELRSHHLYVTGSLNEPSGNHHMEGVLSGLPVLYIKSGGIPEYCKGYGVEFELRNLEGKLEEIIKDYDKYWENLDNYKYTFESASEEYLKIIENLISNKNYIIKDRKAESKVIVVLKLIFNKVKRFNYHSYFFIRILFGKVKRMF